MPCSCRRWLPHAAVLCLAAAVLVVAADEPELTEEQIEDFFLTAKVVHSRQTQKGITQPWRLTLSDGKLTHDAAFQTINEQKRVMDFPSGRREYGFRDSYHFNIAAYELAKLLGISDMIPVTVEYRWKGKKGSLSWWVPHKWDEQDRLRQKLEPPDVNAYNKQLNRMWVFSQLVYDTDPNQTNMLISEDWKLWRIDFTRAFRTYDELEDPRRLLQCCRKLWDKLRQLDEAQVREATKPHLSKQQVRAIMKRRDKIVARFERLIAEKGEDQVLY